MAMAGKRRVLLSDEEEVKAGQMLLKSSVVGRRWGAGRDGIRKMYEWIGSSASTVYAVLG